MLQEWHRHKAETFVTMADIIVPEPRTQFAMAADLLPFDPDEASTGPVVSRLRHPCGTPKAAVAGFPAP